MNESIAVKVFVYGTLKPGEENYALCRDRVLHVEAAIASAHLYHLPLGYPAIMLGNGIVHGYLLSFSDPTILNCLDEYETEAYDRQQIEVFTPQHDSLGFAWAYVMTPEQITHYQGILVPSGCWTQKYP
jgi:gamma-glutamylcyclotransferase (GGCT)/AIG2-like uncharacterized protein YtfP